MMQPYARLVVLHLAVLFGGWIVADPGSPLLALLVLVALKTRPTSALIRPSDTNS